MGQGLMTFWHFDLADRRSAYPTAGPVNRALREGVGHGSLFGLRFGLSSSCVCPSTLMIVSSRALPSPERKREGSLVPLACASG